MKLIENIHEKSVYGRRIGSLQKHLSAMLPETGTVLDVGCGDGLLASLLAEQLPNTKFQGIDVLIRPETKIPVAEFDGLTIPMEDNSVDAVMMVDVLHHTEDPEILVREAKRVARKWFVLKDHTRNGLLANSTLRFMDWVGNARHGVVLPYNYLSKSEWDTVFANVGMTVDEWNAKPKMYGPLVDLVFGRSLHFVARMNTDA